MVKLCKPGRRIRFRPIAQYAMPALLFVVFQKIILPSEHATVNDKASIIGNTSPFRTQESFYEPQANFFVILMKNREIENVGQVRLLK